MAIVLFETNSLLPLLVLLLVSQNGPGQVSEGPAAKEELVGVPAAGGVDVDRGRVDLVVVLALVAVPGGRLGARLLELRVGDRVGGFDGRDASSLVTGLGQVEGRGRGSAGRGRSHRGVCYPGRGRGVETVSGYVSRLLAVRAVVCAQAMLFVEAQADVCVCVCVCVLDMRVRVAVIAVLESAVLESVYCDMFVETSDDLTG
jgi:hypothetical protein